MKKNITPISRNDLFFSENAFNFETNLIKSYIEQDMNTSIILYSVDRILTSTDDVYEEVRGDKVRYKPPVEINCLYTIDETENKAYDKKTNNGRFTQTGVLTIQVLEESLKELGVDILFGDYIGVQITPNHMEYFSVADDGKKNFANSQTMYGRMGFWREIKASSVDAVEFNG